MRHLKIIKLAVIFTVILAGVSIIANFACLPAGTAFAASFKGVGDTAGSGAGEASSATYKDYSTSRGMSQGMSSSESNQIYGSFLMMGTYTITSEVTGGNGTIEPLGIVTTDEGSDVTFKVTAYSGYFIKYVKIDGVPTTEALNSPYYYTFEAVSADHTIEASFISTSEGKIWDGEGSTNKWSEGANWTGNTTPDAGDTVVFNSTSVKNSTVDADFVVGTVQNITIEATYTGTIEQTSPLTVTLAFSQEGGYFNSDYSTTFIVGGSFSMPTAEGSFKRFLGSGILGDPYLIKDIYGLQAMKCNKAGYFFKMNNGIDASSTTNWNPSGAINLGFSPIGTSSTNAFTGNFNGNNNNGFTIINLYISRETTDCVGLFGYGSGETISYVGLVNITVKGSSETGGLVGHNNNSASITNSYATGEVTGTGNYTGGLVGWNYNLSNITSSYASAEVNGNRNTGGLIGRSQSSSITNCSAEGDVNGTDSTGGLLGGNQSSSIINSHATGKVSGTDHTGGLVGYSSSTTIESCYAIGEVTGSSYTGGLVGYNPSSSITNSYATGEVNGTNYVGGLIGRNENSSSITNSYATGAVNGVNYTGGLVGWNYVASPITNCYATGIIGAGGNRGGFIGGYVDGTLTFNYWYQSLTHNFGLPSIGNAGEPGATKVTSEADAAMKQRSTFSGWNFDSVWLIDENKQYPYLTFEAFNWNGASGDWTTPSNWKKNLITQTINYPSTADDSVYIGTTNVINIPAGTTLGRLQLGSGVSNSVTLGGALTITDSGAREGSLTLLGGTFSELANTVTVYGNFKSASGVFAAGTGTVEFLGSNPSSIEGSTTFHNFKCTQGGKALTFEAGSIQTIEAGGTFNVSGDATSRIILRSTVPSTRWKIDPLGSRVVGRVDVATSENITLPYINPPDSLNSGNTVNWFSGYTITATWAATAYGTIEPVSKTTYSGSNEVFIVRPNPAYYIAFVKIDTVATTDALSTVPYYCYFNNIQSDHSIEALFLPASEVIWTGAGSDNNWSTAANWSSNATPDAASTTRFGDFTGSPYGYQYSTKVSTVDASFAGSVNNVTIETGYSTVRLEKDLTVTGNAAMSGGEFNAATNTLQVGGDFTRSGSNVFTQGTSTVDFIDATKPSVISGSTVFNNLTCTTAGKALTFEAGQIQTIEAALTLSGEAWDNAVILRSSSDGAYWNIDPRQHPTDVYGVDVKDSYNVSSEAIRPENSVNRLNNIRWFSDTLYTIFVTWEGGILSTVEPYGIVTVEDSSLPPFTITAEAGYYIASIEVDTVPVTLPGPLPNTYVYTWDSPVTDNHTMEVIFTLVPDPPEPPTSFEVTAISTNELRYNWNTATYAAEYKILDELDGIKGSTDLNTTTTTESAGLLPNTAYTRKVQAWNILGAATSEPVTRYTSIEAPFAATFEGITATGITIYSSNEPSNLVTGESGIKFEITSPISVESDWEKTNGYPFTGLSTAEVYTFRLTTKNGDGMIGGTLEGVTKWTLPVTPEVAGITVTGSWDATPDQYHFDITIGPSNGNSASAFFAVTTDEGSSWLTAAGTVDVVETWIATSEWKYVDLSGNQTCTFEVKAKNGNVPPTVSGLSVGTFETTPPSQVQNLTAESITSHSAALKWGTVEAAVTYKVSIGTDEAGTNFNPNYITTEARWDIAGLTANTEYYWSVQAINDNGYGKPSEVSSFWTFNTYVITTESAGITPAGTNPYDYGETPTYLISPSAGYHILNVLVDGGSIGATSEYTFDPIAANHSIEATFAINTYVITTESAGITPAGTNPYDYGETPTYLISPSAGYHILNVFVDGGSIGATSEYTFDPIAANHSIEATFAINTYVITTESAGITPAGTNPYDYGETPTYLISPSAGYHILNVFVDGGSIGATSEYTFDPIAANHSIEATFAINTYLITTESAGITPAGTNPYDYGETPTYLISPSAGYHILNVLVDGGSIGATSEYTFDPIAANHSIEATFAINTYVITTESAGITPAGTNPYDYGETPTYLISPSAGYHILNVFVDGGSIGATSEYTFDPIAANHSIEATFAINTYVITTESAGITPAGTNPYDYGETPTYTIATIEGYHILNVFVDGGSIGATSEYTFDPIAANHSIEATFAINTYVITTESAGITPAGTNPYDYGETPTYLISPSVGYHILNVLVDGGSIGATSEYTFDPIAANHSIEATFAINTYLITTESAGITPAGTNPYDYGETPTYLISPSAGYHILNVFVDGGSIGATSEYTFDPIAANHSIEATFAINTYVITTESAGITPAGINPYDYGETPTYTIATIEGYHILNVFVDGGSIGATSEYTFDPITTNHSIEATFAINTYLITAEPVTIGLGTIIPGGTVTKDYNSSQTYIITPDPGWHITNVLRDGSSVGPVDVYTFEAIVADHTIEARFAAAYNVGTPAHLRATVEGSTVVLTWSATVDAASYNIYWAANRSIPVGDWDLLANTIEVSYISTISATSERYYLIRAKSPGDDLGGVSTMACYKKLSFTFNPSGTANINWISLPYTCAYLKASDVVTSIEGGTIGPDKSQKINILSKWSASGQTATPTYFYNSGGIKRWAGTDFVINAGDALMISLSGNTPSFNWDIAGVDKAQELSFTFNPSGTANINWISLPYTCAYLKASDVVTSIEGGTIGPDKSQKINILSKWSASGQTATPTYFYNSGGIKRWAGTDFVINAGDALMISLSGIISPFQWTPGLKIEPVE